MNPIKSGRPFFGERPHAVYDVLAQLPPGLMLDVGAAGGAVTKRMLHRSPQSHVIAFEPFPGNYPHFANIVGDDSRVTLMKVAVASEARRNKLFVAATVTGSEKGWEKLTGYSSGGFLIADDDERGDKSVTVDTVRIDDVIGDQHVRFMKVDVQGGELGVLRSAEQAITQGRIDFMFVEFGGEEAVLNHLLERGMRIFDSEYLLIPRKHRVYGLTWNVFRNLKRWRRDRIDMSNWDVFRDLTLTTGATAHRAWPRVISYAPNDYCQFFARENRKLGTVWTDIVAVAPHFVDQFTKAASAAAVALD